MANQIRLIFVVAASILLASCASQPSPPASTDGQSTTMVEVPEVTSADRRSAEQWLTEAKEARRNSVRQRALLNAAEAYQRDSQWHQSSAILSQIRISELTPDAWQDLRILQARFAAEQEQWSAVNELLTNVDEQLNDRQQRAQVLALQANASAAQGQFLTAALKRIQQQFYAPESVSDEMIWALLQRSSPSDFANDFQRPTDPLSDGWVRLVQRLHQALKEESPVAVQEQLQQWLQSYPDHPAQSLVESRFRAWLEPRSEESRVLVLLPLSGDFAAQGQAIRDGIVMALLKHPRLRADFIDTQTTTPEAVVEELTQTPPDFILGPLIKEHVQAYRQQFADVDIPQLYLNEVPTKSVQLVDLDSALDQMTSTPQYFFALDAESEVSLAANYLYRKGRKQPLVLAPETRRGQELADTFARQWAQLPTPDPSIDKGFYSTTDEMKRTVQLQLGVLDSERRINAVKIAAGKIIVDADPRSRPDIDAIYLTGNVEQARLLKPFIDVNTSAFAQRIPVYASSASHLRQAAVSENDLHQVIFSEMPWLLPSHPEQQQLDAVLNTRSGWNLGQARLIAMGHDGLELLPFLALMAELPGYQYDGLAGKLRIINQRIQRQLSWAQFEQHKVRPLAGSQDEPTPAWSGL